MSTDKEQILRLEHLYELRLGILEEMEEADRELSRIRMTVERAESDLRIGDPGPPNYEELKGHRLPQAEGRGVRGCRFSTGIPSERNCIP